MMEVFTEDLCIYLSGVKILKSINIRADKGQFIGIIGPNGSGKSTLLKCIYRVLKPKRGAVFLDGKELADYSLRETAQKIGVVAQHNNTSFDFNVLEMTMMGRAPHKKALERDTAKDYQIARDSLRIVGMGGFEERSFSTLSGGERQRVILARALAQQTPCLILDEPTNHLDIKYQLQLMRIVKDSGRTIISAIHDLNIAAKYCDILYVLNDGYIHTYGKAHSILTEKLIWDVFGVQAEIVRSDNGLYIIFKDDMQ